MTNKPHVLSGAVGGLAGGVLFALVLHLTGWIDTAGLIVGIEGSLAGWTTIVVVGLLLGVLYAYVLGRRPHTWATGSVYGLVYGAFWWVLGTLIILPLAVGQPLFTVGSPTPTNLIGFLLLGLTIGLVVTAMSTDRSTSVEPAEPLEQAGDPEQSAM